MSEALRVPDDTVRSPDASSKGGNAYYLPYCNAVGHSPSYAACLQRHAYRERGELDSSIYSECNAMIGRKTCPVIQMRKEEIVNGKAIYFIDREKLKAANANREQAVKAPDYSSPANARKRGQAAAFYQPPKQPELPERPVEKDDLFESGSYAAAINNALKEEAEKPEVPVIAKPSETVVQPPVKSGLSLIEMARLRAANKEDKS